MFHLCILLLVWYSISDIDFKVMQNDLNAEYSEQLLHLLLHRLTNGRLNNWMLYVFGPQNVSYYSDNHGCHDNAERTGKYQV